MQRASAEHAACAARIEALESELRQLKASVDQMHRRIDLALPETGGAAARASPAETALRAKAQASCEVPARGMSAHPEIAMLAPSAAHALGDSGSAALTATERRALRRASWAAGVALIAAFAIIAAHGGWVRLPAQTQPSTASQPRAKASDQRPTPPMSEAWRLRAKLAF